MKDYSSREDRIRTPVKGLRQRLRVALKSAGLKGKFRTDHLRRNTETGDVINKGILMVMQKQYEECSLHSFEGIPVWYTVFNRKAL